MSNQWNLNLQYNTTIKMPNHWNLHTIKIYTLKASYYTHKDCVHKLHLSILTQTDIYKTPTKEGEEWTWNFPYQFAEAATQIFTGLTVRTYISSLQASHGNSSYLITYKLLSPSISKTKRKMNSIHTQKQKNIFIYNFSPLQEHKERWTLKFEKNGHRSILSRLSA